MPQLLSGKLPPVQLHSRRSSRSRCSDTTPESSPRLPPPEKKQTRKNSPRSPRVPAAAPTPPGGSPPTSARWSRGGPWNEPTPPQGSRPPSSHRSPKVVLRAVPSENTAGPSDSPSPRRRQPDSWLRSSCYPGNTQECLPPCTVRKYSQQRGRQLSHHLIHPGSHTKNTEASGPAQSESQDGAKMSPVKANQPMRRISAPTSNSCIDPTAAALAASQFEVRADELWKADLKQTAKSLEDSHRSVWRLSFGLSDRCANSKSTEGTEAVNSDSCSELKSSMMSTLPSSWYSSNTASSSSNVGGSRVSITNAEEDDWSAGLEALCRSASRRSSDQSGLLSDSDISTCASLNVNPSVASSSTSLGHITEEDSREEQKDDSPSHLPDKKFSQLLARRKSEQADAKRLTVQVRKSVRNIRQLGHTKIYDLYSWEDVLQENGDGGKVVVCRAKMSLSDSEQVDKSKELVLKISQKQFIPSNLADQFRRAQVRLLNLMPHPGVMPMLDVFEDDGFYYQVMDRAKDGTIFQSLLKQYGDAVIPGAVIKKLMREIFEALAHVHRQGMLHRDIKPDNIVMHNGRATLIDFDHADPDWNPYDPAKFMRSDSVFGTARFSAPETFTGCFTEQSDLYSVGAVLYLLMTGKFPRDDSLLFVNERARSREEIYSNLKHAPAVDWTCDPWPADPGCRDFCCKLLEFSASGRPISAAVALEHAWLRGR